MLKGHCASERVEFGLMLADGGGPSASRQPRVMKDLGEPREPARPQLWGNVLAHGEDLSSRPDKVQLRLQQLVPAVIAPGPVALCMRGQRCSFGEVAQVIALRPEVMPD